MKLRCTHRGTVVPTENINPDRKVAKCSRCDSVFSFTQVLSEVHTVIRRAVRSWFRKG